ncbi:MAG: thiolase family protein [Dehalococcoidales bacterium]|nr:MAG: thiolase family protein [Dehalococcoidales bacterium]
MRLRNAVVVDGVRTAFTKGGRGKLEAARMDDLGAYLIRALLERNPKVKPTMIEDVGIGGNLGRGVVHLAGLPQEMTDFSSERACATSQETAQRISMAIMLDEYDCGISVGVERMGRAMGGGMPRMEMTRRDGFNPKMGERTKEQRDMPANHFDYFSVPIPDYILDSPMASMTQTGQNVCEMYDLSREEIDAFSMRSQHKLAKAYDAGIYKDEVLPVEVEDPVFDDEGNWVPDEVGPMVILDRDEGLRPNTTMEGLAALNPVRGIVSYKGGPLLITAGNSCPTNCGVTAQLIMSEEMALKLGVDFLARVIGWGNGGCKQQIMGVGPVVSTPLALKHAGLEMEQIDRIEFNEAFACQVVASMRELGMPEEKVNVNGGSIGIGHPICATGNRLWMTVCKELKRSNTRYGMATQCCGDGEGMTVIFENPDATK